MKSYREIKVAVLAIVCLALLFFGFNFLKGVNIFSPVNHYIGQYADLGGLVEQAPVYIRGYKVGQVDKITYDFTREAAFDVSISIDKQIQLPQGSEMVLVADGLLGGKAIEIVIPSTYTQADIISRGDTLPTQVKGSLIETLENELLAHVDSVVLRIDSLLCNVQTQIEGNNIKTTLNNLNRITTDLTVSSADIKLLTHKKVPQVVDSVQSAVLHANAVMRALDKADVGATVKRIDTLATQVSNVITSKEGTLGKLLYDKSLYAHIDSAVVSADSLLTDLKAHPKRYVHFSVFGNKDKKKKAKKK